MNLRFLLALPFFVFLITSCIPQLCRRVECIDSPHAALEKAVDEALIDKSDKQNDDGAFAVQDNWLPIEWWKIFEDPQLDRFIQFGLERNPTLEKARLQIFSAIYAADRARAALLPTINYSWDFEREKLSKTGIIPNPSSLSSPAVNTPGVPQNAVSLPITPGIPFYYTQYETQLKLMYDFDLWGKNRSALAAAIGEVNARIADEIFSRLAVSISISQAYFKLQTDYTRERILSDLSKSRKLYVEYLQNRALHNIENAINISNALSNLARAEQLLLIVQGDIAITKNQLHAYLAGSFDENIEPIDLSALALIKAPLPAEIPMRLLAHRPDISAQLWLIHSAEKRVDVARKAFYPDLNLSGLIGFQTIHLKDLFEGRSVYGYIGPAFSLPLFTGGLLEANYQDSGINYNLAINDYNDMVLNAAREALDGIALVQNAHKQYVQFHEIAQAQQSIANLTRQRALHHLSSKLDEIIANEAVLTARDQETVAIGDTINAILMLFRALGGGYDASACSL